MVQQIDEMRVTTTAPPRDPTEVLIEEVRQQARHRRRRDLALVLLALLTGSAAYVVTSGGKATPPRSPWSGSAGHGVPALLVSAVNKTLAVRSVEIVSSYEPSPAVYQAPNLYAAPEDVNLATASDVYYISGDAEFFAHPARSPDVVRVIQFAGLHLGRIDGLPAAQESAFEALLYYLRGGTDFTRTTASIYTFRTRTVDDEWGGENAVFVDGHSFVGEISLANGYVASVTIGAPRVPAAGTLTTRYEYIDDNPHLVAPEDGLLMCRSAGSLVLQRCSAAEEWYP